MANDTSDVIKTMSSYLKIKYNEVDATKGVTEFLEELTYTDFASGSADSLSVTLFNQKGEWLRKGYFPKKNDWVKAWIYTENWPIKPANGHIECGQFQIDHVQYSGYGERVTIEGIAVPQKSAFSFSQRNKTWKKTTVTGILKALAKKAGITCSFYGVPSIKVEEISQSGSTDLEFAFSLCSQYDLALKMYNKKMVVYDRKTYESKKPAFTIDRKELQGSYTLNADVNSKFDSVKLQYTNKNGDTLTYSYTIKGEAGNRTLFISTDADSTADAEKKAKAQLRQSLRESITASFSDLMGGSRYKAGIVFTLTGFGQLNGNYFIDQVTHSKGSSKYTCSLEAHKVVTGF